MSHISVSNSATLSMNTPQPSKSCMKPSAIAGPQRSTSRPMPPMRMLFIKIVIGENEAHREQREQVTQTAACLGHLQLHGTEIDHIAFEKDTDARGSDQRHAELGRDELQFGGETLIEKIGQRDHQ